MRSMIFGRSVALAAVLTFAAACGSDSSGPTYRDEMLEGDAEGVYEETFGFIQTAFSGMDFGSPGVGILAPPPPLTRLALAHGARPHLVDLQRSLDDGCTISAGGTDEDIWDPIDANGNDVPDDWTLKVICVETNENEGVIQLDSVKYGLRIKERTTGLHGFDATAYYISHETYSDGDDEHWGYEQTHNVSITSGAATATYRFHQWEKYFNDGVHDDWEMFSEVDLALAPTAGITTIEGDELADGELTITGSIRVLDNDDGNFRFELSTPEPWLYSYACANDPEIETSQRFVGGTLEGLFNGDENTGFYLTWTPCGTGHDFGIIGDDVPLPPE
jgi:hypothetical protein